MQPMHFRNYQDHALPGYILYDFLQWQPSSYMHMTQDDIPTHFHALQSKVHHFTETFYKIINKICSFRHLANI